MSPLLPLLFLRHGATALNAAGLRCGGDIDLPLNELGHRQAQLAARELADRFPRLAVIVASGLQRTRQTADIIARHQRDPRAVEIVIAPAFNERRLGQWNRLPVAETEAALVAGITPPGGESSAEFSQRIREAAVATLLPLLSRQVLLVGSKGVARVLGELAGVAPRSPLGNAEIAAFDLSALLAAVPRRGTACIA